MSHVWNGNHVHRRADGFEVEPGEEFEPTEAELRAFPDLLQEVKGKKAKPEIEPGELQEAFGKRIGDALAAAGISSVEEATALSRDELIALEGIGEGSADKILEV